MKRGRRSPRFTRGTPLPALAHHPWVLLIELHDDLAFVALLVFVDAAHGLRVGGQRRRALLGGGDPAGERGSVVRSTEPFAGNRVNAPPVAKVSCPTSAYGATSVCVQRRETAVSTATPLAQSTSAAQGSVGLSIDTGSQRPRAYRNLTPLGKPAQSRSQVCFASSTCRFSRPQRSRPWRTSDRRRSRYSPRQRSDRRHRLRQVLATA